MRTTQQTLKEPKELEKTCFPLCTVNCKTMIQSDEVVACETICPHKFRLADKNKPWEWENLSQAELNMLDTAVVDPEKILHGMDRVHRGMVWCTVCNRSQRVDPTGALFAGWPKCCNYTMTIDSPAERQIKS